MIDIPWTSGDGNHNPTWHLGYADFWKGVPLAQAPNKGMDYWKRGWWMGWARAYAQGAILAGLGHEVENPYPQFSGAWEAWSHGYEERVDIIGALTP